MSKILALAAIALTSVVTQVGAATTPVKKPGSTCNMTYQNCLGPLTGKGPAKPIVQNRCFKEQKFTTNVYGRTQGYYTGKTICI